MLTQEPIRDQGPVPGPCKEGFKLMSNPYFNARLGFHYDVMHTAAGCLKARFHLMYENSRITDALLK